MIGSALRDGIEWLLLAGAHEVLARSPWATLSDPAHAQKVAAAAAVVAYARVCEERRRVFGVTAFGAFGAASIALLGLLEAR